MMMNQEAFFCDFIKTWEDGGSTDPARTHSLDRDDPGNWTSGICGKGECVGSNHGVTAAALGKFRNVPAASIGRDEMHRLTVAEAAKIGQDLYYRGNGIDFLPWDPVVASLVDMAWGAGPVQAVKLFQRLLGTGDDGHVGRYTVLAYGQYLASHGIEVAALSWQATRNEYYRLIVTKRPVNAKYLRGWTNRSAYYAPDGAWWRRFLNADTSAAAAAAA